MVLPRYGHLPAENFHSQLLADIQSDLLALNQKPASVNRAMTVIKAILGLSAKHRRIGRDPSIGFDKLMESTDAMRAWEEEEAQEFLAFADKKYPQGTRDRQFYLAYLLSLNTGLRAGELWGLRVCDLQRAGRMLQISKQFDRVSHQLRPTKGRANRLVPLGPELSSELQQLIRDNHLRLDSLVFRGLRSGAAVNHDFFAKKVFARDLRESGLRAIRFHDLRHTAATLMIAKGVDIATVQAILGHQKITTTMNYVHLLGRSLEKVSATFSLEPKRATEIAQNR